MRRQRARTIEAKTPSGGSVRLYTEALWNASAARDTRWLVLLHGFTGACESMAGVAETLCDLAPTLRIDLVGHGRSDVPEDPELYSMPSCVAQVRSVLEQLEVRRPHLAGYSMGGRVALSLAAERSDLLRSLILVGASAGIADPAQRADRVDADCALAQRILDDGLEAFVDDWMSQPLFASQSRLGADALARARTQRLANSARGLALSLRGMGSGAQPPLHGRLADIAVPTCLVVGSEDAKFRAIAADLAAQLGNAEVAVVPEAGHAAHLENPSEFRRAVVAFFERLESRAQDA